MQVRESTRSKVSSVSRQDAEIPLQVWLNARRLVQSGTAPPARNRQLLLLLLIPPLVQTVLFGVALKPIVKELSLAVADESKTWPAGI